MLFGNFPRKTAVFSLFLWKTIILKFFNLLAKTKKYTYYFMARKRTIPPEERSKELQKYYARREEKLARVKKYQRDMYNAPFIEFLMFRLAQVRGRAKLKNLDFELDREWVESQPNICSVTCVPFVIEVNHPCGVSFDRKDPNVGYTKENTRLVCSWYNTAKSNYPEKQVNLLIIQAGKVFSNKP